MGLLADAYPPEVQVEWLCPLDGIADFAVDMLPLLHQWGSCGSDYSFRILRSRLSEREGSNVITRVTDIPSYGKDF